MRYRWLGWILPLLLVGCGGSETGAPPGDGDGDAARAAVELTIQWPTRAGGRLLPTLSESIRLELTDSSPSARATFTRIVSRPAGGGTTVVTFDDVTPGPVTARATAYPAADAQGVAQATAQVQGDAAAGQVYRSTLTMASTVTQWVISPPPAYLVQGQATTLTVAATDAAGATVLVPPAAWQAVNGANLVALTPNGNHSVAVTGLLSGPASIVATSEQQAGQADSRLTSAPVIVTVVALPAVTLSTSATEPGIAALVTFTADASADPALGQVVSFDWDLDGDGTFEQTGLTTASISTSYATAGPRTITVRITDNFGLTATAQVAITVQSADVEIVVQ